MALQYVVPAPSRPDPPRSPRGVAVVGTALSVGFAIALGIGCEPRHKGASSPTGGASAATSTTVAAGTSSTGPAATTPTGTTTAGAGTATAPTATTGTTPTAAPTPTYGGVPTSPPPVGTWPTPGFPGVPGIDPAVLADLAAKAAALGFPVPATGTPGAPPAGDTLDAALRTNAAKYAPGFSPATPVGRGTLKQGEHAGMNVEMQPGKCYVMLAVGSPSVTQLGLNLLFPATPPNAVIATDASHGNQPVIGAGKPMCPPIKSSVRVDAGVNQGSGEVAVQVWVK